MKINCFGAMFDKLHNFRKTKSNGSESSVTQTIYFLTISAVILILVIVIKDVTNSKTYIYDSKGNTIGIERKNEDVAESFTFQLHILEKNNVRNRKVVINKSGQSNKSSTKEDIGSTVDTEIDSMISDIELSEKKRIILPVKLSDGTRLIWEQKDSSNRNIIYIIVGYISIITIVIIDKQKKPNFEAEKVRKGILEGLPRFVNQLLMLLNSGMILSDALDMICESYKIIPEENRCYFEREIIEVNERFGDSRISTTNKILELAKETNVKELMRIASILSENEKRGSVIVNNLSRESRFLWEDRKIIAKERGRIIDTKMSYPLGILLVLLIIITMAPAMLTI